MDALKLVAFDRDDIEVVSAHLQDAVVKTADIRWRPAEKRVVVALNRFDWEAANGTGELRRRRAALRFDRVTRCRCRNIDTRSRDTVLNLLAVTFIENDPPQGVVTLTFSGGGTLRLEVECLEAELADLGPIWLCRSRPHHPDDADPEIPPVTPGGSSGTASPAPSQKG